MKGPWGSLSRKASCPSTFPDPKDATSGPSVLKLCLGLKSEEATLKLHQRTEHKLHGYEGLTYRPSAYFWEGQDSQSSARGKRAVFWAASGRTFS